MRQCGAHLDFALAVSAAEALSMTSVLSEARMVKGEVAGDNLSNSNLSRPRLLRPVLIYLGPAYLLLLVLIFGNEILGKISHYSIRFFSPAVFVFQSPALNLKFYGLFLIVGVLVGLASSFKVARFWSLSAEDVVLMFSYCIAGGALGARLYWVALCWPVFVKHPGEIFNTAHGGLSIHGCILGVFLSLALYCRLHGGKTLSCFDFICTSLPLAQAIWRWGNLFNSEAFGAPLTAHAFLQQFVAPALRPSGYLHAAAFQPAFFFEGIWNLALFFLLYFGLAKNFAQRPGLISCVYLGGYSLGRLLIESIRLDSITCGAWPVPTIVSLICLICSCAMLFRLVRVNRPG
jgi:phosphatidylglycerol:prolipoprotein diacylglycerol transferase